jgi:hypothetical protein
MICTKNDLQADLGPVSSDFVSPAARNSDESCWSSGPDGILKRNRVLSRAKDRHLKRQME